MKSVQQLFSEADQQQIKNAVAAAESITSAEIVPVIEDASYDYPRAELLGALALSLAVSLFFVVTFKDESLWWFLFSFLICFPCCLPIFRQNTIFKRIFIHPQELKEECDERARIVFLEHGIAETEGRNGVLIFISLFERKVVVLADKESVAVIDQQEWDKLLQPIIQGMKTGLVTEGLCHSIELAGAVLASKFPPGDVNRNELPDLIL